MFGNYERGVAVRSIEPAKKIADVLDVSLNYLVGASSQTAFDRRTLDRIQELEQLEENKKQTLYDLIDTYIRDAKARRAYSL
ncbi:helix-turn-helix domain-containing protein [Sphingobacterium kyonggiense]